MAAGFALTLAAAVLGWWRPWQAAEPTPPAPMAAAKPPVDDPRPLDAATQPKPPSVATAAQVKPDKPAEPGPVAAASSPAELPATLPSLTAATPAAPVAQPAPAPLTPLTPAPPPVAAAEPLPSAAPVARTRREASAPEAPPQAAETAQPRRSEPSPRKTAQASPASPPAVPVAAAPVPIRAASPADDAADASSPTNRKTSAGRILSIHELPPAIRGSLPRLSISGVAAAPNAGKSWALINDRLVQEGEEIEPGLTLTSAAKDGVVLDYKGYRFRAQQ
ncbi:general secretion pathway protein GspB [Azoarcus sp. DN11]|uniref:general secretion pathway protein GspB n=1 Tax=Azoarcus sp. DN11 TaxID=356837 RepID=UPI000EB46CCD|nr:general secretion pathway protein GspB [Azoarcus sp. DN11]AYH43048.1 hypothetical protein CDA09_06535 [Azoarcus sp. DN11]